MNYEEIRMAGRERWHMLLAEAEDARRIRRPQAARGALRPRLARGLVSLAARIDPAMALTRRASTSL